MAMTKCKECGNEISTKAESCPKCGAKRPKSSGCAIVVAFVLMFFAFSALVGTCSRSTSTTSKPASSRTPSTSGPKAEAKTPPPPAISGSQWIYSKYEDPMAKGATSQASVQSSNTVAFGFPYQGPQRGRLSLRTHPRHGKDVIFQIEKGQILCRSYEDCIILIRFDDGAAEKFSAVGAADNSTETIFIRNYSRFVQRMLAAKRVRLAVSIYQQGEPVFDFDVSGFDQEKYK